MTEPVERLKKKVQKENLWLFILDILSKKEYYGYELRKAVQKQFGFLTGTVTAYKVIYLLEKRGYVKNVMRNNRKYYKITPAGKTQLKKAGIFLKEMLDSLGR